MQKKIFFDIKLYKKFFLENTKSTIFNMLIVVNEILDNDIGKTLIETANYFANNNIGVVIFTKINKLSIVTDKKILVFENSSISKASLKHIIFAQKIRNICKNYKIDVINMCSIDLCRSLITVYKNTNFSIITTLYNTFDISTRWKFLSLRSAIKADLIFAMSNDVINFLLNNIVFDLNKLKFFNICINDEIFNKDKISKERVKDLINNELNFNIEKKQMFYCPCDFTNINEIITILKAIKLIDKQNVLFVFSGIFKNTKPQRLYLLKIIKDLNLENNVLIIDAIKDRPSMYLSSYAILFLQTKNNTYTRIFNEACLMCRPSIEICCEKMLPMVINEKNGFFVKTNNVLDIKNAIIKIISLTAEEYNQMCQNAYQYITKYFNKDEIYHVMINEICECIKKKQNSRYIKNKQKNRFLS